MASRFRMFLVLLITAICLVVVLWGIEPDKVWDALTEVELGVLPLVFAVQLGVLVLRVLRFHLLLGDGPSFSRQFAVCTIAFMAINVVPFRLGEFVRPFLLTRDGVPWGRTLGTVVIERVVDLFALLGMLVLVGLFVELPADILVEGIDVLAAGQKAVALALVVLVLGLVVVGAGGDRILAVLAGLPVLGPRLEPVGRAFQGALTGLVRRPGTALVATSLGVAIWAGTVWTVVLLLSAFPGLPQGLEVGLTVTAMTVAGTVAIPTPGFFGPFEVFCKAVLVLWGTEPDLATTFAVVWHMCVFAFHALAGALFLGREGMSLGSLVRESRNANSPSRAESGQQR